MVNRRTWEEFRESKLLWWVNRILHTFGWAIVYQIEKDGKISEVYPARVKFRGFTVADDSEGFVGISEYLKENINEILEETKL